MIFISGVTWMEKWVSCSVQCREIVVTWAIIHNMLNQQFTWFKCEQSLLSICPSDGKITKLALKEAGGLYCALEIRPARPKTVSLVLVLTGVLTSTPQKTYPPQYLYSVFDLDLEIWKGVSSIHRYPTR